MSLKEYNNSIVTKEKDDPITQYLKNIIQRYFEIENDVSQSTKESIIIQAYTRLKEIFNAYSFKKYSDKLQKEVQIMMCINERSGTIDLCIQDLNGEEAFEKHNAFNKNFCNIKTENKILWDGSNEEYSNYGEEETNHIVAGDDDRLSDARIPLIHIHSIEEIPGLNEIIEQYHLTDGGFHLHKNLDVLDMIQYIGSSTSIDLAIIEHLINKTNKSYDRFLETDNYFTNIAKNYLYHMNNMFEPIYNKLQYISEHVNEWAGEFLDDSKNYTNTKAHEFRNKINAILNDYVLKQDYTDLSGILNNAINVVDTGYIDFINQFEFVNKEIILNSEIDKNISGMDIKIPRGLTIISTTETNSKNITGEVLSNFYNNNINNGNIKFYFEYTKDGISYRDKLPHLYHINNDRNDMVLIFGNTDSDNNINIYAKRIHAIPFYIQNNIIINAHVYDKAGNISNSNIILNKDTTSYITNNAPQSTLTDKLTDSETITYNSDNIDFSVTAQKSNPLLQFYDEALLQWTPTNYNFQIYKKYEDEWEELFKYTILNEYNFESHIYDHAKLYKVLDTTFQDISSDKETVCKIDEITNNIFTFFNNDDFFCMLLSDESYGTYRHNFVLTSDVKDGWTENKNAIVYVISAVNQNGTIHTLSLVVSKNQSSALRNNNFNGCSIIFDYFTNNQIILATFNHGDSYGSNWNQNKKINFDVRKDKQKIYIYMSPSGFYDLANLDQYTVGVNSSPSIILTFNDIYNQTGIDFKKGKIGYGNVSQQGATFIGMKFECYDTPKNSNYTDNIRDDIEPNIPNIKGKCLSSNDTEEIYDIEINGSDQISKAEYKFVLLRDIDWSIDDPNNMELYFAETPLKESNVLNITNHSGFDKITFDVNGFDDIYENIQITNTDNTKKCKIKITRPELDHKIIFNYILESNEDVGIIEKEYLKLIKYDFITNEYIYEDDSVIAEQEKQYIRNIQLTSLITDSPSNDNDEYFCEYDFNSVRIYFPDAKVYYQLFRVPGKGV